MSAKVPRTQSGATLRLIGGIPPPSTPLNFILSWMKLVGNCAKLRSIATGTLTTQTDRRVQAPPRLVSRPYPQLLKSLRIESSVRAKSLRKSSRLYGANVTESSRVV